MWFSDKKWVPISVVTQEKTSEKRSQTQVTVALESGFLILERVLVFFMVIKWNIFHFALHSVFYLDRKSLAGAKKTQEYLWSFDKQRF